MSSSNVDPMKKSSIYATFGRYYGEKLYKLLFDCCSGLPGSFCYEVLKCLNISPQGNADLVLNQQGEWITINTDGLLRVKVTVTSEEILDAYDTPIELIPAPPAGFYIDPISIVFRFDYDSTPYATNPNGEIHIGGLSLSIIDISLTNSTPVKAAIIESTIDGAMTFTVDTGNPTAGDSDLIIFITYQLVEL